MNANKALHPISVVAERTGLSADLLRVWERRYAVVEPARDEAGRRLYTDADVERLTLLGQATAEGRSISQLLRLSVDELRDLVRSDEEARWSAQRPRTEERDEAFVDAAMERTRRLDAAGLEAVLERSAAVVGAAQFLETIVAPLFRRIGDAWHAGELGVAQEHMASGVARSVISRVRARLPVQHDAPMLIVATLMGERHEIGALLAAATAELEGWRVTYLGSDLPAAEVAAAATAAGARAVALSSIYPLDPAVMREQLRELRAGLAPAVDIYLGGPGLARLTDSLPDEGITVLPDLAQLRRHLAA